MTADRYRPFYRPDINWTHDPAAIPPLDRRRIISHAELAESTVAGCKEWEENAPVVTAPGLLLDIQQTRAYAAGVADVLGWLAGGPLTQSLAELLELPADTETEARHYQREEIISRLLASMEPFTIELAEGDTAYDVETGDTFIGPVRVTYSHGTFPGTTYRAEVESLR